MNKIIHAVILAFFGVACWFVWGALQLSTKVIIGERQLPAFTRLCLGLVPILVIGLAVLATVYCVWVLIRKADNRNSWVSFLATTMAALVFVTLPTMVAVVLPLVDAVNHLAAK